MSASSTKVECLVETRPSGRTHRLSLDLNGVSWYWHGPSPARVLRPKALDLLDVARTIHEIDKRISHRVGVERVRRVTVRMPLRDTGRWKGATASSLARLLAIMGNTEWQFSFRQRSRPGSLDDLATDLASRADSLPRNASSVVLFSGGLDSTSGLGTLKHAVDHTLLVSYYAANLRRQQNIAASLGFTKLVQVSAPWQDEHARAGGQFSYRAFFYLALAAVIADSMRVPSITQFENGPLALAVPPSRIYRMTRHAHPLMHMEAENFFKKVLGQAFVVENPFYLSTKREAVQRLAATVADTDKFKSIVRMTETCWYLKSMTIVGKVKKRVSQPCGVCIPCIVRRTALGSEDDTYAIDLLSMSRNARDPVVRVHLDAYLDYSAHILDRTMSSGAFLDDVPDVTARALAVGRLQAPQVFDLYRRFAKELRTTFSP